MILHHSKKEVFLIEKINLIEISEELNIAKETVRRKINELNNSGVIERSGKKIILHTEAFKKQRPLKTVTLLANFLSIISRILSEENRKKTYLLGNHIHDQCSRFQLFP